jgi:hypothetical protein
VADAIERFADRLDWYTVSRSHRVGETMTIGTTEYLPLGITAYRRRGYTRRGWQVIGAVCVIATAVLIAAKAQELITLKPADVGLAGTPPVPAGLPAATETSRNEATRVEAVIAPIPPPSSAVVEPAGVSTLQAPSPPTVLRGAGAKAR